MTTFLLILSLILNLLALLAIMILFLRQNRLSEVEKKQEKMIHEMEEVISNYLIQMKEENDQFLKKMQKVDRKEHQSKENEDKHIIEPEITKEIVDDAINDKQLKEFSGKVPVKKAASVYQKYTPSKRINILAEDKVELPPLDIIQEETATTSVRKKTEQNDAFQEQSLLSHALNLQSQGYSEEDIAKKLNKGKTEIALLLKFNQNF